MADETAKMIQSITQGGIEYSLGIFEEISAVLTQILEDPRVKNEEMAMFIFGRVVKTLSQTYPQRDFGPWLPPKDGLPGGFLWQLTVARISLAMTIKAIAK